MRPNVPVAVAQFFMWGIWVLAALFFVISGSWRALHVNRPHFLPGTFSGLTSGDFVTVYSSSRALLQGGNPYTIAGVEQAFLQGGGHDEERFPWAGDPPIHFPFTLLLMAPLADMPYHIARGVWLIINLSTFLAASVLTIFLCERKDRFMALLLTGVVLAGSTALPGLGNMADVAIGTLIVAIWATLRRMPLWIPVVAFSVSILLKPQMGIWVVLFLFVYRDFRKVILITGLICGVFIGVSVFVFQSGPTSSTWIADFGANMRAAVAPNAISSPTRENPDAMRMTDLQPLFSLANQNPGFYVTASLITTLFLVGALALACRPVWRLPDARWLGLAAVSCLSLLVVYHRLYDSRLLLISMPAMMILLKQHRFTGLAAIFLTIPVIFSFSFQILDSFERLKSLSDRHGWVVVFVGRQAPVALILLTLLYIFGLNRLRLSKESSLAHPR